MATHVVRGNDGEPVYLNDAEYKKYKSDQFNYGCLVIIVAVIIAVWVALSGRSKSNEQPDVHNDEPTTESRTGDGE